MRIRAWILQTYRQRHSWACERHTQDWGYLPREALQDVPGRTGAHIQFYRLLQRNPPALQHRHEDTFWSTQGAGSTTHYVETSKDTLGGCLPPAARHPLSVFHGMVTSSSQPFQYEVNKNRWKVNNFRRKSTFLGKESTSPVKVVNCTQTRQSTKSVWVS